MPHYPGDVLEQIFGSITSNEDRNSISLVCKSWFKAERNTRRRVVIGNCYAISPAKVIARFPNFTALSLKGRPAFADFDSVPLDLGVLPWIQALAKSNPKLEELRLIRMVISDESLKLISHAFSNFQSLVLIKCVGFTSKGLSAIAANCRYLRELDLQKLDIPDSEGSWLKSFPETNTSLVSLNFACLKGWVDSDSLKKLVLRCPKLKKLNVNITVPFGAFELILNHPYHQLEDLGIVAFRDEYDTFDWEHLTFKIYISTRCGSIRSLSGIFQASAPLLVFYPICVNLTTLNLSYEPGILGNTFMDLISLCKGLQRLLVLDSVGDKGLEVVGSTCKELLEFRVFPSDGGVGCAPITEAGLVALSVGCRKLCVLVYFCNQMTNAALITVAKNCPNLTRLRLSMVEPEKPDPNTLEPFDEGFGAIVQSCKSLRRLSVSGLITDMGFLYIGMYGVHLETLSVASAGDSEFGMQYVLNGCRNLRKLEIMNSHFGDGVLLEDVGKCEKLRTLCMSSSNITLGGCKALKKRMPTLKVEVKVPHRVAESRDDAEKVEKIYVYRILRGCRGKCT